MTQPSYVSRNGLERLKSELEQLPTVRRQDIADRIQQSREKGGVESNAEYEDSKNELAFIEGRILTLDNMINSAVIIKEGSGSGDTVEVGNTIAVKDQDGQFIKYTIVGSTEADPSQGRISNVSPIGGSLLGKWIGEIAEIDVPSVKIRLEVMAIE
jgi:transcription elongation factor GreA